MQNSRLFPPLDKILAVFSVRNLRAVSVVIPTVVVPVGILINGYSVGRIKAFDHIQCGSVPLPDIRASGAGQVEPFVVAEHGAPLLQTTGTFIGTPNDFRVPWLGYSLPQANHGLRGVVDVGAVDSPDGVIATIGGDQDGGAVGLCRPDRFITRLQRPRPPFGTVTVGEKHHAPVICVPV